MRTAVKFAHRYGEASGPSLDDCHVLAYRWDARREFHPDYGESWVLQREGGTMHALLAVGGWLTGLWRSPSGRAWTVDVEGRVRVSRGADPRAGFDEFALPSVLAGVWGLDDACVWAWGGLGDDTHTFLWDGASWRAVPSPGRVTAMHGLSPDMVYAVGTDGLIAWWDGGRWHVIPSPARVTLSSVFVASSDEMYACGPGRRLLEGTAHGWSERLAADAQLLAVACFAGNTWVAGPELGLTKLQRRALAPGPVKLAPSRLDVRGAMLLTCEKLLAETADGVAFRGVDLAPYEALTRGHPKLWR